MDLFESIKERRPILLNTLFYSVNDDEIDPNMDELNDIINDYRIS